MAIVQIGSISHGTLRSEDLIIAFAYELERLDGDSELIAKARALVKDENGHYTEPEYASEMVNELSDALQGFAPEGCYFGTLEGDGSDFGFWQNEEEPEPCAADECNNYGTLEPPEGGPKVCEGHIGEASL